MSIIQFEDLVSYQLRSNYLDTIKDGVGERLITINDTFLNNQGFKAAGWLPNPNYIKRTHSPPIPTATASEYFAPHRSTGLSPGGLDDDNEDGGMITGGGIGQNTVGPGLATKRRRRREQMEEEDSSDLSDDSDDDVDQRAAQQIKFAKMPVRNRSGSSPIRGPPSRESSTMTSPARNIGPQGRRGSQSALETVKERARRDTVTSSDMSSENEFDSSRYRREQTLTRVRTDTSSTLSKQTSEPEVGVRRQESDLLEEELEDDSDGSDMSSAFAESVESTGILDSVTAPMPMNASPAPHIVGAVPRQLTRSSPKKNRTIQPSLQALPPPRPISMMQPKSVLSQMIKAKRTKAAMPFESFASLSGQGDPNPLSLRIWVPFSNSDKKFYEVLIRRAVHGGEASGGRQVVVSDLIGLSLWIFMEEKMTPAMVDEQLNVNRWTLRLIDDEEVDYDFPALDRTKPVITFSTINNRGARARSGSKTYDEFALVEATAVQFEQNQVATPQFQQESTGGDTNDELTPISTPAPPSVPLPSNTWGNPLLNPISGFRSNMTLADMPTAPVTQSIGRSGAQRLIRVHIYSTDALAGQVVTVETTSDAYLAEVLDMACKKKHLDKGNHVLKMPGAGTVVFLDRTVESIGQINDLDLYRRRFATDGPLNMSSSPGSTSPQVGMLAEGPQVRKIKKNQMGVHPLSQEAVKQDEVGNANYRKWTVWRKAPMRFVGMNERIIAIDGEYLQLMPGGKTMFEGQGKSITVHFSHVVGCKVSRRHPINFKLIIFRAAESKRYDFEAKSISEAAEIVHEVRKGCQPYQS